VRTWSAGERHPRFAEEEWGKMQTSQFLALPENRAAVAEIVRHVLAQVAPDEIDATAEFLEPLLDVAAADGLLPVDSSDEAGRFGSGLDLMIQVLVPAVSALLANLLATLGQPAVTALREARRDEIRDLIATQASAIFVVIRRTRSRRGRRRSVEIVAAITNAIEAYAGARAERRP
jgi:hypothetical protein